MRPGNKRKAQKKGNRDAFLLDSFFRVLTTKLHLNKKKYTRKKKHK